MGVDASAIGGIGNGTPISTDLDHYRELGLDIPEDKDDSYESIESLVDVLEQSDLKGCTFRYTYGYDDPELYVFVDGENIDEIYANVPNYIEGMKRLGIEVDRKDIGPVVISFFS